MAEKYEVVCEECSKTFETEDECANICDACWQKMIALQIEHEGK